VLPTPEGDGLRKRCAAVVLVLICDLFINSRFSFVELEGVDENLVSTSWLSQPNPCISGTMFKDRIKYQYGTSSQKWSI
jgi:hypothetical protein